MFTDAELVDVAAHSIVAADGTGSDAIDLAVAWQLHVRKIDQDRALPSRIGACGPSTTWPGALFLRDRVERSLERLRPDLGTRVRCYVATSDERFRSFTVEDSERREARRRPGSTSPQGTAGGCGMSRRAPAGPASATRTPSGR